MKLEDESIMPFGKYEGKKMEDVPAGYLIWLHDSMVATRKPLNAQQQAVKDYCYENWDVLQKQDEENKRW